MNIQDMQRNMTDWLVGDELAAARFDAAARAGLDVYQNNYRAQLVASLSETFARVKAWLGEDAFLAAAARHIDTSPPNAWTLDEYGRDFPQTLRALLPSQPEVPELAWLDRALVDAFVGPDANPLVMSSAANVDWENAVFKFTPTLRLGRVETNSTAIWSALSANTAPPQPERLARAATVLVWRREWTACFRTIDDSESMAIESLSAGATFGQLCSRWVAAKGERDGAAIAGTHLARWLQDQLLVGLESPRT
jgi:hypothetical protein